METNDSEDLEGKSRRIIEKDLSYRIVGCALQVHRELGFGFLESIYSKSLEVMMKQQGLLVDREHPIEVRFRGVSVGIYRVDMLVERRVIVEVKSTEKLSEVAKRQLRNYLSVAKLELGLVLHFGPRFVCHRVLGPWVVHPNNFSIRRSSSPSSHSDA